jgi:hypothetical protein
MRVTACAVLHASASLFSHSSYCTLYWRVASEASVRWLWWQGRWLWWQGMGGVVGVGGKDGDEDGLCIYSRWCWLPKCLAATCWQSTLQYCLHCLHCCWLMGAMHKQCIVRSTGVMIVGIMVVRGQPCHACEMSPYYTQVILHPQLDDQGSVSCCVSIHGMWCGGHAMQLL